jgi:hypothetical protein
MDETMINDEGVCGTCKEADCAGCSEACVPFEGFYETVSGSRVSEAALREYGCEEHGGRDCDPDACVSKATSEQDRAEEDAYAKEYVKAFGAFVGVPLEYVATTHPKQYNFATDRIFARVKDKDFGRVMRELEPERIRSAVRDRFTSRDGFCSFYDHDFDKWTFPLDHNQVGAVLECYAEQKAAGKRESWAYIVLEDVNNY